MNSFFNSIMSWLRGVKASMTSRYLPGYTKTYIFGHIISGRYRNYKHDPNPTIFCMGTYINPRTGRSYVHGFNLHYLNGQDLQWFMKLVFMMKHNGRILDPRSFYIYIKTNRPSLIENSYRIYHTALCDYKTISPGISSLDVKSCYSVVDSRDFFIKQLNQMIDASFNNNLGDVKQQVPKYNAQELQDHIQMVLNTRKVW